MTSYRDQEIGGTAFGEAFDRVFAKRYGVRKHSRAAEIRKLIGPDLWSRYLTFAFVRNPYARALSTYYYLRHHRDAYPIARDAKTASAFVEGEAWLTRGPDRMLEPQVSWLLDAPPEDGGDASGAFMVDLTCRSEEGASALNDVLDRLELPAASRARLVLPEANVMQRPRRNVPLSAAAIEAIRVRYARDFVALGYDPDDLSAGGVARA